MLIDNLNKNNVDAKVHYPIPMHLQEAAKYLNYTKGSFPMAEKLSNISISLSPLICINQLGSL